MRRRTTVALLWIALLLVACQQVEPPHRPKIEAVPLPADLDSLDPSVRDQLRERYNEVERRLANANHATPSTHTDSERSSASAAADVQLGRAFGELGQVLASYRYWPQAQAAFATAEQLDPAPRWSYYLGHAERGLGRLGESAAAFERTLTQRPNDVPALVWLGENELDLGQLDPAREHFQKATDIAPNCVQALFGLGRVALEQGDTEAASGPLEAALQRQPGSSRIRYSLALAYRQQGSAERAAALFAEVTSDHRTEVPIALNDPLMAAIHELRRGPMAHERRGLRAAARGQMKRAVFELQQAVALDPERFEAWHNLGLALLRLNRRQEGEQELHRLLERHPEHAPTHLLLGNLAIERDELDEAERAFRAAVAADPHLPAPRRALATLLRRTGRSAEAGKHTLRADELSRGARTDSAAAEAVDKP